MGLTNSKNKVDYAKTTLLRGDHAAIERNNVGAARSETYYRDGKLHRDGNLPAVIKHNKAGVVTCEEYLRDGILHRDGDLPAVIERNDTGVVTREWYWRDGKKHRDGYLPARIDRADAGVVVREEYWRDGKKISREQIQNEIKMQNMLDMQKAQCEEFSEMKTKLEDMRAEITNLREKYDQLLATSK